MDSENTLLKITARLLLAGMIITLMILAKSFLIPFTWSLLIAMASLGLIEKVQNRTRLPLGFIIFLYLLLTLAVLGLIGYFFYIELSHIFKDLPTILAKLSSRMHDISLNLKDKGIHIPDHVDKQYIDDWVAGHNDVIMKIVSAFGMNLWNIILIMFYLFFLLYYKDLLPEFLLARISNRRKLASVRRRLRESMGLVRNYLYGLLMLTLISAVMNFIVFLIFGLEYSLFFAVFLAILNLIPFIGNPIGLAVIMLFSIITKDSFVIPLLIFVALFIMNFLQDNVIRPWLIGDKLKINAFIVFVAIIIGGMIWGVSGMILFIPIVGSIRIILEGQGVLSHYNIFFAEVHKKPTPAVVPAEENEG